MQSAYSLSYVLAAPRTYFAASLQLESEEWVERVIRSAGVAFDGFWVLDYEDIQALNSDGDSKVVPEVDCNITRVATVQELRELCV